MRIKLEDLQRAVLNIGFVGENKHSVIEIDCAREFDLYPDAIPTMVVTPPKGEPYPVVISWEDGIVFWEILGGDLARDGDGEIQITFTQGDVIGKSYKGRTRIHPSITASGVMPEPWADWITEFTNLKDAAVLAKQGAEAAQGAAEAAQLLAENAQSAAEEAAEEAEVTIEKYPFVGSNGNWTVWNAATGEWEDTQIPAQGPTGATGPQGQAGVNGVVITTQPYQYAFYVNSSGHLILLYDGEDVPGFSINENGHLIYTLTT